MVAMSSVWPSAARIAPENQKIGITSAEKISAIQSPIRVIRRTCRRSSLAAAAATMGMTARPKPMPRISTTWK